MFTFWHKEAQFTFDIDNTVLHGLDGTLNLNNKERHADKLIYLKFSSKCNLKCTYCFQLADEKSIDMTEIKLYSNLIEKITDIHKDSIIAFGGEPFIDSNEKNLLFIFNIMPVDTKIDFITNGVFSTSMQEIIYNNKDKIGNIVVTLDGDRQVHNKRRVLPGGDSFEEILKTIDFLTRSKIGFIFQVNIDTNNSHSINELLSTLDKQFGLKHIIAYFNRVLNTKSQINELDFLMLYKQCKTEFPHANLLLNSPMHKKLSYALNNYGLERMRCGVGKCLVFDFETEKIYTCPHSVKTQVGYFDYDNMYLDEQKLSEYEKNVNKSNDECNICEYRFYCKFGCVLEDSTARLDCKKETETELKFIFENFDIFHPRWNARKLGHRLLDKSL
ncbi:MAG: radical SAM protein [Defluviitaleaceae bacterium]|nr:radical SAM protein [Defluviitaleaceae bacterium]